MSSNCNWDQEGSSCGGKVEERIMFNKQIKLNICNRHYRNHVNIMVLCLKGYDIEKVLDMNDDDRQEKVDRLVADGFDMDSFEA